MISHAPVVLSLLAVAGLLATAVAQPVVEETRSRVERSDVEAYVVIDTSKSMLAAASAAGPTRLERAKQAALRLRQDLPEVRFGIASLTDRTLPYLFPTGDPAAFRTTIEQSVGVGRPPPQVNAERATALDSLTNLADGGFYTAPQKIAVVFTDGESQPVTALLGSRLRKAGIQLTFVHVWRSGETVHLGGKPDPGYRPDASSARTLGRAAALTGGVVLSEGQPGQVVREVERRIGTGAAAKVTRARDLNQVPVAKWFVLAAFAPLAFLLLLRNVPLELARTVRRPGTRPDRPAVV